MAAGGALAGGLSAPGDPQWAALGVAMAASLFGVAGGNALNDAADAEIDRRAHPRRPIPRGDLTVPMARAAAAWFFAVALTLLMMTNASAAALGAVFIGGLIVYEWRLKARGLVGNVAVSILVGGTFLLGALAAQAEPFAIQSVPRSPGWVPLVMAGLAAIANLARELYKDLQDMEFDLAWRQTLPLEIGDRTAFLLARGFLVAGVALGLVPAALRWFDARYAILLAPALTVFAVTVFVNEAGRAAALCKTGMALALVAFVAIGLI